MKKILNWLFSDFLYNLYQHAEYTFCKSVASNYIFALFKNGTEIPNTRFTSTPITYSAPISNTPFFTITGTCTIDITQNEIDTNTGDIELRNLGAFASLAGPDLGGTPTSSVRASLNFEKVS